jgi:lipopolysaccharide export system permease protein
LRHYYGKYRLKKLHVLVLKAFIGPFFATFFVAIFVLLMQFLWKYVDDLVGKGLDGFVIGELLFYSSASLIPMALPLAILLSSIMTFGNLGEHYEMVAIKAAGVPLRKVFAPMFVVMVFICIGAFFISNIVIPKANLKSKSLLYDVRQQKPSLLIKEGIFNNDIEGYSMRIGRKGEDNETIYDVVIYDNRVSSNSGRSVIVAEYGKMTMSEDKRYLFLNLYKGKRYEEMPQRDFRRKNYPHNVLRFGEEYITIDLSSFSFSRTNEDLFKDSYHMLNVIELRNAADSVYKNRDKLMGLVPDYTKVYYRIYDTLLTARNIRSTLPSANLVDNFRHIDRELLFINALSSARTVKSITDYGKQAIINENKTWTRYWVEWHRKYTLSFACMVLFFIGAPLGTIIRKGGFGTPVVISVILYVLYHIISMMGEKFARQLILTPFMGMWFSTFVLTPLGIFLTYKASVDSNLFNAEEYTRYFHRFKKLFSKKEPHESSVHRQ